jgi:serine/threonine-protein kinase HipA
VGYGTWDNLQYLMETARRLDEGLPVPADLETIFAEGSPLGGARPKATVRSYCGDGNPATAIRV